MNSTELASCGCGVWRMPNMLCTCVKHCSWKCARAGNENCLVFTKWLVCWQINLQMRAFLMLSLHQPLSTLSSCFFLSLILSLPLSLLVSLSLSISLFLSLSLTFLCLSLFLSFSPSLLFCTVPAFSFSSYIAVSQFFIKSHSLHFKLFILHLSSCFRSVTIKICFSSAIFFPWFDSFMNI